MINMLKPIVIYYSKTGNTKKVARAIAESLETKAIDIQKVKNVWEYNLIVIGTPVHGSKPSKTVRKFLETLPKSKGKYGGAFCTMMRIGDKKTINYIKKKMIEKDIDFLDGFSVKGQSRLFGFIGPRIINRGKPDEEDLEKAKEFGKELKDKLMKKEIEGKAK